MPITAKANVIINVTNNIFVIYLLFMFIHLYSIISIAKFNPFSQAKICSCLILLKKLTIIVNFYFVTLNLNKQISPSCIT